MDGVSSALAALEIAGLCLHLIKRIRYLVEATRNPGKQLLTMIRQLEKMRLFFEALRAQTMALNQQDRDRVELAFSEHDFKSALTTIDQQLSALEASKNAIMKALKIKTLGDAIAKLHSQEPTIVNLLIVISR